MSDPVWIAVIVAIPPTLVGMGQIWLGVMAKRDSQARTRELRNELENTKVELKGDVHNLHKEVNGRMTDLIQATEKAASATGRAEGIASEQAKKP